MAIGIAEVTPYPRGTRGGRKEPISIAVSEYGQKESSLRRIGITEELRIGTASDKDKYFLNNPSKLLIDEQGRLYVLDPPEGNVKIFDQKGNFLGVIGKKGKGPGELDLPSLIGFQSPDRILIYEVGNKRISVFNPGGKFVESVPMAFLSLKDFAVDSSGSIYCVFQIRKDDHFCIELHKFGRNFEYIAKMNTVNDFVGNQPSILSPYPSLAIVANRLVVFGFPSDRYEFDIFSDNGIIKKRVTREIVRDKITREEVESLNKNMPKGFLLSIPKYYPPYYQISSDDESRIIVYSRYFANRNIAVFDLFSSAGDFIESVRIDGLERPESCIWRAGHLYAIKKDEDGFPYIGVFRMRRK